MSRLLALPGEIRNQIYHDVFEDSEVENLQFLQTSRQIHVEAGSVGFSSTVFTIDLNSSFSLLEGRLQNLSHDRKSCIKTVCREMVTAAAFRLLRFVYKASILPTTVILLPHISTKTWSFATGLRHFSLCVTPLQDVLSDVVMDNANLANLTFSKVIRRETHAYGEISSRAAEAKMMDARFQLEQYQLELDRWVTVDRRVEAARVEEIERCCMGLKEVRIIIKMKDLAVQRVLSVRWVMVLGDGGNK